MEKPGGHASAVADAFFSARDLGKAENADLSSSPVDTQVLQHCLLSIYRNTDLKATL